MQSKNLVGGLKHCHEVKELTPGETYIVRFKNPAINYKTDLWMGIILPDTMEPGTHLHRRPKGSRPENGPWTTPLNERAYPVYMPARNTYRWASVRDLFLIEKEVPWIFTECGGRNGAEVFRDLHRIAKLKPGIEFWEKMSHDETQAKGKRGRCLKLILPEGFDNILDRGASEDGSHPSTPNSRSSSTAVELDDADTQPPKKVAAHGPSFSTSRSLGSSEIGKDLSAGNRNPVPLSFPGDSSTFLSYGAHEQSLELSRRETSHSLASDQKDSSTTMSQEMDFSSFPGRILAHLIASGGSGNVQSKIEEGDNVTIDNGRTCPLDMTLKRALECIFLQKSEANEILAMFKDAVAIQKRPESEQIRSFLTTGEFVPRLVQVNDPTRIINATEGSDPTNEADDIQVGDRYGFGRRYQLQGINDSKDLCRHIRALGRLYQQARRFGLATLIEMIALKLQVAWNSYPGLCQIEPLLGVTEMAFKDGINGVHDHLQRWLIGFMADILDLIYYAYSERFWEVMHGNSALQKVVFEDRAHAMMKSPDKYIDPRVLLRSRGIDQV